MAIKNDKRYGKGRKKMLVNILIYAVIAIVALRIAFAIPSTLTLQGKLTNANGASQSGTFNFTFKIYDAFTNGNILWQEINKSVTTDANGIYDIILHNLSALNFSDQYYLGIAVMGDNESVPRINLSSTPYAFRANISEQLNRENRYEVSALNVTGNLTLGTDSADALSVTTERINISDGNINAAGNLTIGEKITFSLGYIIDNLVNGFLRISGKLNVTGNVSLGMNTLFVDNTSGNVGIGTASPTAKLEFVAATTAAGGIEFGDDVTLYRSAANTLKTDDAFDVAGAFKVTTGGAVGADSIQNYAANSPKITFTGNSMLLTSAEDAANIPMVFRGAASQTADLTQWQNSAGTVLAVVDKSGKVGIGTTAPATTLDVKGKANFTGNFSVGGTPNILFVDNTSGKVGIGTINPLQKLEVAGNILVNNTLNAFLNLSGPILRKSGNDIVISD